MAIFTHRSNYVIKISYLLTLICASMQVVFWRNSDVYSYGHFERSGTVITETSKYFNLSDRKFHLDMLLDISKKTTQNKKSNYTRVKKSVVNNQKRTQQFRVMADKKETIVNLVYWYVIGTINWDITLIAKQRMLEYHKVHYLLFKYKRLKTGK